MYRKVKTDFRFQEREKDVLKFWKENDIFRKSMDQRKGAPEYTFFDGPPTANGTPHIGHVLTRAIKDLIPRYRTMKGYHVLRKAGWDTHGLPVELEVEKMLGLDGKEQIETYGVEPFIQKCKESVWKYESLWRDMSDAVGFWADMDDPYVTYHNDYIESEWWALKKIWDDGLLYKGHKIVPYCPRCGTALSSHEVAQGYKDVKETSIFVKFPVKGMDKTYFLAWTTTPWTLPSNVALAVNPGEIYVDVTDADGVTCIMAKALVSSVFGDEADVTVSNERPGKALEYMEYEPLYTYAKVDKKAYYVVCEDYVTMTDGSGVVHTAPAFGEDDANAGHHYNLPFVQTVDTKGEFVAGCGKLTGLFVKDADPVVIADLKERGLLFRALEFTHSYPFCWRCDTPLIYYARNTWFISMTKLREKLLANNETVNWMPDNIKHGRFGNFLDNVVDWGLSRERYWGTPLPIWECDCGHKEAIGSIAELREKGHMEDGSEVPADIELHKPYIDRVHLTCPHCGKEMKRVPEVIDCWFDSGSMPFAQWHYPFENKEVFEQHFPADFISEAIDQTRGWFYTLMAVSTLLFGKSPYKNVLVMGLVQDKDGRKMSKHLGNGITPQEALDACGADAVRWYFYNNSAPWLPSRFSNQAVKESMRQFMNTANNNYAFYVLYADIDRFDPTKHTLHRDSLPVMDRWILSRLQWAKGEVDRELNNYRITEASKVLLKLVDDTSNIYIRACRKRFWQGGMNEDKENAFMTLFTVLKETAQLMAPFVPFFAEDIYRNIVCSVDSDAPISVHLTDFPEVDETLRDEELERRMELVNTLQTLGHTCREKANIKIRQPLQAVYVVGGEELPEELNRLVREELNVKEIRRADDASGFLSHTFKPQLKTVGPKYGRLVGKIGAALSAGDGDALYSELKETGKILLDIDGEQVTLEEADLQIFDAQKTGFVTQSAGDMTLALDTTLTDALVEEGFLRETVSKLQAMRKDAGFEVVDRIRWDYDTTDKLDAILSRGFDAVSGEVLGVGRLEDRSKAYKADWKINGEATTLYIAVAD